MWIVWKTMWKFEIPMVFDVNNSVENFKSYLHFIFLYEENLDIHKLYTQYSQ